MTVAFDSTDVCASASANQIRRMLNSPLLQTTAANNEDMRNVRVPQRIRIQAQSSWDCVPERSLLNNLGMASDAPSSVFQMQARLAVRRHDCVNAKDFPTRAVPLCVQQLMPSLHQQCCNVAPRNCASFSCTAGTIQKPNPSSIPCPSNTCTNAVVCSSLYSEAS
jgi:hypothetical protein